MPQDIATLRTGIIEVLQCPNRAEVAANSRRIAVEEYRLNAIAKRHEELYASLIGRQ